MSYRNESDLPLTLNRLKGPSAGERAPTGSGISGALKMIKRVDLLKEVQAEAAPYTIRPVQSRADLEAVYRLTHDAYLDNGVIQQQPNGMLVYAEHLDHSADTTVWIVLHRNQPVATVSLTKDGSNGMIMEEEFAPELAKVRNERRRLGGVWRLVVHRDYRKDSKIVQILISHATQWLLRETQTGLIVVAPRHAKLYQKLLNMLPLAAKNGDFGEHIHGPTVLLRWDLERCPVHWMSQQQVFDRQKAQLLAAKSACWPALAGAGY
jgi:hypothetical protein